MSNKKQNMSEHELKLLGGKAELWKRLHPDITNNGICRICPHLHDWRWCRENPRLIYNKETRITKIRTGYFSHMDRDGRLAGARYSVCIEWVKHV
jgi:hypothetical protein